MTLSPYCFARRFTSSYASNASPLASSYIFSLLNQRVVTGEERIGEGVMHNEKLLVTQSSMPPYEEYIEAIKPLWNSRWITNMGCYHRELEERLKAYLDYRDNCYRVLSNQILYLCFVYRSVILFHIAEYWL